MTNLLRVSPKANTGYQNRTLGDDGQTGSYARRADFHMNVSQKSLGKIIR